MKRSPDRILTSDVGSLIRPDKLQEFLRAKQSGKPYDEKGYNACLTSSVAEIVKEQADVGLDVDVCRAVAAAIFGDAEKVKYVPLTSQQRFTALQSGEVDMLSNNTTLTLTRDTALGFDFGAIGNWAGRLHRRASRNVIARHVGACDAHAIQDLALLW